MTAKLARAIAEAYRWQRSLGARQIAAPHCHIVANPDLPEVWDHNHADNVTAESAGEIDAVLAAVEREHAHTPWRVFHTDRFTPDAFLARLALEGYEERPATIQMALDGDVTERGAAVDLRPVETEQDWAALLELVVVDFAEGNRTPGLNLPREFCESMVAGYRARYPNFRFHLAIRDSEPAAYGAYAIAPNGAGMIEDLFTLQAHRRQGVATGMIATFADGLRAAGCSIVFIGAPASESPKRHYARLGFRPIMLARTWVRGPA